MRTIAPTDGNAATNEHDGDVQMSALAVDVGGISPRPETAPGSATSSGSSTVRRRQVGKASATTDVTDDESCDDDGFDKLLPQGKTVGTIPQFWLGVVVGFFLSFLAAVPGYLQNRLALRFGTMLGCGMSLFAGGIAACIITLGHGHRAYFAAIPLLIGGIGGATMMYRGVNGWAWVHNKTKSSAVDILFVVIVVVILAVAFVGLALAAITDGLMHSM